MSPIIIGIVMGFVGITSLAGQAIKEHAKLQRFKLEEETKRMQYQKELLELEIKKEETYIRRLQEESKKYDRIIEQSDSRP
jgi:hypothetical protein